MSTQDVLGDKFSRCSRCSRFMVPRRVWGRLPLAQRNAVRQDYARSGGRGLCVRCWGAAKGEGALIDFERKNRPVSETLLEWAMLKQQGYSVAQAADRLGLSASRMRNVVREGRAA